MSIPAGFDVQRIPALRGLEDSAYEHPDLPVLTIHDSFLTPDAHLDTVHGIVVEEFLKLGIAPGFKIERNDAAVHAAA